MNLKALAVSSVMAMSSLFVPASVEARTPWIYVGSAVDGQRQFVKNLEVKKGITYYDFYSTNGLESSRALNCSTGQTWVMGVDKWLDIGYYLPGSMGEAEYKVVCLGHRPSR